MLSLDFSIKFFSVVLLRALLPVRRMGTFNMTEEYFKKGNHSRYFDLMAETDVGAFNKICGARYNTRAVLYEK